MNHSDNIAARAGRWSAQHRKKAVFGWLTFVIASIVIGGMIGTKTLEQDENGVRDSGRADKAVFQAFPKKAEESVLVQSKALRAQDPAFKAAVADVIDRLSRTPHVKNVESPYAPASTGQISPDGRSALVNYDIPGSAEQTEERVDGALASIALRSGRTATCASRRSETRARTRRSARASRTTSRRRSSPRCR